MELILMIVVIILVLGGFALLLWRTGRRFADFSLLMGRIDNLRDFQERTDRSVREEIARSRAEARTQAQQERTEITGSFKLFEDSIQNSLSDLTAATEKKIEAVRLIIDTKLREIQEDNSRQLDRMRETVDEKLQTTLEKRLGESFRQVSERLEMVHQGLGQMRELAADVGNLQKVLTNVKARGTWGEVQLGALLEEMLSPEQYLKNVRISETGGDVVEFAIKLPGQSDLPDDCVLIPVDAKFPIEDYQRLLEAQERGDVAAADESVRQLETGIKKAARDIFQKYIAPPKTTDFGIMFLPSEGLYAEVIRRTALVGVLQREYHIVVTGPTTFAALLNSLQMGFRTLAIQKRSGEVWKVLGEVKTAFGRFGDTLDNVRKKLEQAANSVDDAQKKTKTLSNKLKAVEASTDTRPTDDGITDDMPSHRASEHE
ncbi:MAG TPA: DNA recombination protein RmuC [Smithella sp.]|jgi:DNA recombination protein RmuC|nr:DNA recombination protein RmuC [Smithella sp.]HOG10099.1 DNA recombination protein RmuC [Smithella sp.]HOO35721.1 DNA recombination protein RmuC [Smithella sp.]HOS14093.1 DNA recombination protein RmuC [Smithella sp.]HPK22302.1 DNA recombination protein RmuC [Smithella sp.]